MTGKTFVARFVGQALRTELWRLSAAAGEVREAGRSAEDGGPVAGAGEYRGRCATLLHALPSLRARRVLLPPRVAIPRELACDAPATGRQ